MLPEDLVKRIEVEKNEMLKADEEKLKRDTIVNSIGSTYLDWVSNVLNEYETTQEECWYQDSIWFKEMPQDFNKLAEDITYVMKDLEISDVKDGDILFSHKNGYKILIFLTQSYFGTFGEIDVYVRSGTNIDDLYYGLYK